MARNSKIALAIVLALGAASASLAQDIRLPKIDLQKLCKQNDTAVRQVISDVSQDFLGICAADEQSARDEIVKEWATFPPAARSHCINPKGYLPSYIEWLACLQMTRDVVKVRKESSAPATGSSDGRQTRRECPIVQVDPDGTLRSVVACPLN